MSLYINTSCPYIQLHHVPIYKHIMSVYTITSCPYTYKYITDPTLFKVIKCVVVIKKKFYKIVYSVNVKCDKCAKYCVLYMYHAYICIYWHY